MRADCVRDYWREPWADLGRVRRAAESAVRPLLRDGHQPCRRHPVVVTGPTSVAPAAADRATVDVTQVHAGLTAAICTRNRPQLLRRALHSLLAQVQPPGEILVVDNAPSDTATHDLVRAEFP